MPWHVEAEHGSCPASKPWAVVKDSDGEVEGCHASKADANKQVAALYANEETMSQTHSPDVDVVRALSAAPELRAAEADAESLGTLSGYFSVHDTWYEVDSMWEGKFLERTAPGFTAATITEDRDGMRVLFDHGFDTIGNKVLGPIDVLEDRAKGPYYEVPLLDTTYNRDLLPGLKRGLYGASFRMRVLEDTWDEEPKPSRSNPKGIPERTITRAKVMEFGPVTFPANPKASASVRSTTDQFYDRLRQRDTSAYEAAVRAAGRSLPDQTVRTLLEGGLSPEQALDLTGRPDARSAGGGESGTTPGDGDGPPVHTIRQRLDDGALRLRRIIA